MRFRWLYRMCLLVIGAVPCSGCSKSSTESAVSESNAQITQIVFLDQETICPIIKTGIDSTWQELQAATKGRDIRVMRVYRDTQGSLARKYTLMKPTAIMPGMYFLTSEEELVDFLQGEKKEEQIKAVLDAARPAHPEPSASGQEVK